MRLVWQLVAVGAVGIIRGQIRGVLYRIIEERVDTWIALLSTAVLLGAWHLPNPNASLWGAIVITIGAGTMLAAAYVATRSLWLPIGLHFGWNIAASAIFSTEVSGNDTQQGCWTPQPPDRH